MMKQLSVGGLWERRRPARNRKAQICRRRRRILPITPPDNVIDIDTSSDKAFESVGSNAPDDSHLPSKLWKSASPRVVQPSRRTVPTRV